jgi:hypothetical protein
MSKIDNIAMSLRITPHQKLVLEKMRASRGKRELYESASALDSERGSGEYFLTYSGDDRIRPLTRQDVSHLLMIGLIAKKYPDEPQLETYVVTNKF